MLAIVVTLILSGVIVSVINSFCVVIIMYSKKIKSPPHMTIFSLLLGHTIQGLIVIPCYAAKRSGIYKYTVVCDIFRFTYLLTNYVCCLSVLAISGDRFVGVKYPLRYKAWITCRKMSRVLLLIWVYVVVWCMVPFTPHSSKECKYNPRKWWVTMMLIVNTLIPFILIIICYVFIFKKVTMVLRNKQSQVTSRMVYRTNAPLTDTEVKMNRDERLQIKRTTITYFIVASYLLCWGPSFVYNMLITLCRNSCFSTEYHDSQAEQIVGFVIKLLTFLDGILAPTVYCYKNSNFNVLRQRVLSSIRKKFYKHDEHLLRVRQVAIRKVRSTDEEESKETSMSTIPLSSMVNGKDDDDL